MENNNNPYEIFISLIRQQMMKDRRIMMNRWSMSSDITNMMQDIMSKMPNMPFMMPNMPLLMPLAIHEQIAHISLDMMQRIIEHNNEKVSDMMMKIFGLQTDKEEIEVVNAEDARAEATVVVEAKVIE